MKNIKLLNSRVRPLRRVRSVLAIMAAATIASTPLLALIVQPVSAITSQQLSPRLLSISTAQPGVAFTGTFIFDLPTSAAVQGIKFQFCDTPLGTCTTANTPTVPASSTVSQNAKWTNATAFGTYTQQAGTDGGTGNQILVTRTQAAAETATGATCTNAFPIVAANCRSISFTGLTNNATANKAYYVRLRLYTVNTAFDDTAATGNQAFYGSVAQSTSQTLTVNARVQERLDFCVGSTAVDDATTNVAATTSTCADVTGTTVDIGALSNSNPNISPVPATTYSGNAVNGVAMVASNASNGTVVSYFGQIDGGCTSTPAGHCAGLKVTGQNCGTTLIGSTPSFTDKCFNYSASAITFNTAGLEAFGATISKVNNGSVAGAYTGTNLVPATAYNGNCTGGGGNVSGSTCTFAWDDSGSTTTIADSSSSTTKVLNYEALILKFAARAAATTPTGQYTVASTYIATSAY